MEQEKIKISRGQIFVDKDRTYGLFFIEHLGIFIIPNFDRSKMQFWVTKMPPEIYDMSIWPIEGPLNIHFLKEGNSVDLKDILSGLYKDHIIEFLKGSIHIPLKGYLRDHQFWKIEGDTLEIDNLEVNRLLDMETEPNNGQAKIRICLNLNGKITSGMPVENFIKSYIAGQKRPNW